MSNNEFYWFCRVLKWSTNFSLILVVLCLILLPFAFFMADEIPWTDFLVFVVFVGWFYMNFKDKSRFIVRDRVCRGTLGVTGVMFPLWQNIVFWFLYILMELTMAGVAISVFAKSILPS